MKLTDEELRKVKPAGKIAGGLKYVVYMMAFFLLCIVGLALYIQAN